MNRVELIGRITKPLELRYTSNNKAVCGFTLAIQRDKDNADFVNCVCWEKLAENLCKYQDKGSLIGVVGELRTRTYEDSKNNKRSVTEVLCNEIEYLAKVENAQKNENIVQNPYEEFGKHTKTEFDIHNQIAIDDEGLPF